jgi:hypothetical protein
MALGGAGSFARLCAVTQPGPACINVCKNRLLARAPRCAEARDCAQGICINGVCYEARHAGVDGDICEYDGDCADGFVCDNDQFRGSSCTCVVPCDATHPPVGIALDLSVEPDAATWAETDAADLWFIERACCDGDGATSRESYAIILFQDTSDTSFVRGDFATVPGGQRFVGSLCGAELGWRGSDEEGSLVEEGVWSFPTPLLLSGASTAKAGEAVQRACSYAGRRGEPPSGESAPTAPECPSGE